MSFLCVLIQSVSELGDFATLFFLVRQHWGRCPIAILLPTLKRFSVNGVMDCSTVCFCCESVLQKQ